MTQESKANSDEAKQRLNAIMRGAFAGPPTPLKDIPKNNGESRAQRAHVSPKRTKTKKR